MTIGWRDSLVVSVLD